MNLIWVNIKRNCRQMSIYNRHKWPTTWFTISCIVVRGAAARNSDKQQVQIIPDASQNKYETTVLTRWDKMGCAFIIATANMTPSQRSAPIFVNESILSARRNGATAKKGKSVGLFVQSLSPFQARYLNIDMGTESLSFRFESLLASWRWNDVHFNLYCYSFAVIIITSIRWQFFSLSVWNVQRQKWAEIPFSV